MQQERIVVGIGRFRTGVARRMHAWRAAERVDFQAGIVGEKVSVDEAAVVYRLADGVLFERVAGFFRRRDRAGKLPHVEIGRGQLKLSQLPGIGGGAVDGHSILELFLDRHQFADPLPRQRQQFGQLRVVERGLLGGGLHFDEFSRSRSSPRSCRPRPASPPE